MPAKANIVNIDGEWSKRCGHCSKIKPLSAFNKCKNAATGYRSQCKGCMATQRAGLSEHYAEWRRQPKIKEYYRLRTIARNKKYPICMWARNRSSRLERKPCEVCGSKKVEAHHSDYLKPTEVTWLCRKHHDNWHSENGPGANFDSEIPKV